MSCVAVCISVAFVSALILMSETVVDCAYIGRSARNIHPNHADQSQNAPPKPKGFGSAKRAVIIGIDGLGGLHLRNATHLYPTFRSFFEQGSYTTRARGVFPTKSGPNWGSYLTGLSVMEHGIFTNGWTARNGDPKTDTTYSIPPVTGRGRPDTIFTQVKRKDSNLKTALMFTWSWFTHFAMGNNDIDVWKWSGDDGMSCSGVKCYNRKDNITMFAAKENLLKNDPVLTFVQLDLVDAAGHNICWGCPEYYLALTAVEEKIKFLIDALKQNNDSSGEPMLDGTLIVIVSDHGGWRKTHNAAGGGFQPFAALVDIPILIRGPGVLKNNSLENTYVSNLDVAATVLNAIGVDKSEFMRGQVLKQIYL